MPTWGSDRALSWEPSCHLCDQSPFIFAYYSDYLLVEPVALVRSDFLRNDADTELPELRVHSNQLKGAAEASDKIANDTRVALYNKSSVVRDLCLEMRSLRGTFDSSWDEV